MKDYTQLCFAEDLGAKCSKCRVLTYKRCIGHDVCSSYKTHEQCRKENIKRIERLQSLPEDQQRHISSKYAIDIWKDE